MEYDVASFLSFELKKELAERYFGFRKLIEDDKKALDEEVFRQSATVEQKICFELVRIYILLGSASLIAEFFSLSGLDEEIFYDPYVLESPTIRKKVFGGVTARGMTRSGKFKRLFFDRYENLEKIVAQHREKVNRLRAEEELIREEIAVFYRKHDLAGMLDFFRRMEPACQLDAGVQASGACDASMVSLEDKLRLEPPARVDSVLVIMPSIPALPRIKNKLKRLVEKAYEQHGRDFELP